MALILHHPSSLPFTITTKPHLFLKPSTASFRTNCQQNPSTEETTSKPPLSPGQGFGSVIKKGKRERASIVRREPAEKPSFTLTPEQAAQAEEAKKNESAFLLTWFGLGVIILLQGLALSASGFLPETWDNFLVKYLYPTFTPTVFLFVAGTVGYGVLKYLQNQDNNIEN